MSNRRELGTALGVAGDEVSKIADLILYLKQIKREKEQQEKEDERAKRDETRAERRLGIAERGEKREIAGIADIKAEEAKTAGALETARGSVGGMILGQYRDVATQAGRPKLPEQMASRLLGAQDRKGVEGVRSDLQTGIEDMIGLIGEQKYIGEQPESIQDYHGALKHGMSDPTARGIHLKEEFPEKEPEVEAGAVTERDSFLQEKVYQWRKAFTGKQSKELKESLKNQVGWDGKKETLAYYRDMFIANQLQMTPEEQELHLGRTAGVPGQVTKPGTPKVEPTAKTPEATEEISPVGEEGEEPQDVEAFVIGYINAGRDIARIDTAMLAKKYDMDEEEVKKIVSHFANTARR